MNPLHLCGECSESDPICCDTVNDIANCSGVCQLRPVFSVQPYGAPALDVEFPPQAPLGGDSIVFMEADAILFRMELTTWTVSGSYFNINHSLFVSMSVCMFSVFFQTLGSTELKFNNFCIFFKLTLSISSGEHALI